jgi:hypothetical protein
LKARANRRLDSEFCVAGHPVALRWCCVDDFQLLGDVIQHGASAQFTAELQQV